MMIVWGTLKTDTFLKYKLDILEEGVGNDKNNETRYLLISKDEYTLPELNFEADADGNLFVTPPTWGPTKNGVVGYGRFAK